MYFEIDSSQHENHIFHSLFESYLPHFFVNVTIASLGLIQAPLPGAPSPGQFWAIMVWVVYYKQQARLRKIHRRLRQLEARLCSLPPGQAAISVSTAHSTALPSRPSSLTARLLISPSPCSPPPFSQPVVGSGH